MQSHHKVFSSHIQSLNNSNSQPFTIISQWMPLSCVAIASNPAASFLRSPINAIHNTSAYTTLESIYDTSQQIIYSTATAPLIISSNPLRQFLQCRVGLRRDFLSNVWEQMEMNTEKFVTKNLYPTRSFFWTYLAKFPIADLNLSLVLEPQSE